MLNLRLSLRFEVRVDFVIIVPINAAMAIDVEGDAYPTTRSRKMAWWGRVVMLVLVVVVELVVVVLEG